MSFLAGMAKAVQEDSEQKDRMALFDAQAKEERRQMLLQIAAKRQATGLGSSSRSGSSGNDMVEVSAMGNALIKEGFNEDRIAEYMATGDHAGMKRIHDRYFEIKQEHQEEHGPSSTLGPEYFREAVESIVTEAAREGKPIDMSSLEALVGPDGFSDEEKELINSIPTPVVPGAIGGNLASPLKKLSIAELDKVGGMAKNRLLGSMSSREAHAKKIVSNLKGSEGDNDRAYAATAASLAEHYGDIAKNGDKLNLVDTFLKAGDIGTLHAMIKDSPRLQQSPDIRNLTEQVPFASTTNFKDEAMLDRAIVDGLVKPGMLVKIADTNQSYMYGGSRNWVSKNNAILALVPDGFNIRYNRPADQDERDKNSWREKITPAIKEYDYFDLLNYD